MKLSKIVEKIKKYLKKDDLKKSQEEKVLKIIEELKEKRSKIKEEIKSLDIKEINKKDELEKKLQAIAKLIKKSEALI
ncbi:hypothetical protein ACNSOS_00670 [Aliarcobacter vitoriensis]|uniref:hypothetical protein n=1 Tax=Aliarcobacter vitoriensis TaxID=2011099 RepID=UPI000DEB509B|nr:hypothetical protein CRU92_04430 [Arcobacter sp. FW59]